MSCCLSLVFLPIEYVIALGKFYPALRTTGNTEPLNVLPHGFSLCLTVDLGTLVPSSMYVALVHKFIFSYYIINTSRAEIMSFTPCLVCIF